MTKNILVIGKNSYIGSSFVKYCSENNINFNVSSISVRGDEWKDKDFSKYDVLINTAGIAHRKETKQNKHLYYDVNRDLAIEIAKKAKKEGINHYVFLSSMSVYGKQTGVISERTPLKPVTTYGKSKLQAENKMKEMIDDKFKLTIIRPPMVYGPNCKGNYPKLSKFARKSPVFVSIKNIRSMIYIENLTNFMKFVIEDESTGIFHPQNAEYVSTTNMVKLIANIHNHRILFTKVFNPIIIKIKLKPLQKVLGNLYYSQNLSNYGTNYDIVNFTDSIYKTEKF